MGTPAYMAPEQMTDPIVGRPADVYSIGAMLFELLAGERLHPRGKPAIQSTLAGTVITSPAARRPDRNVPPELDGLCVAMLAMQPAHRPTAHVCAERIEEFLDGDRDLVRRRSLAVDLATRARAAHDAGHRADAMRDASRALALDPEANGAAEIVTALMIDPPREGARPPELAALIENADRADISRHAKAAIPGYILMAAFLPVIIWNGVLSWPIILTGTGVALALAVAARELMRKPARSLAWMIVYAAGNSFALAMVGRLAGPLTFVPALVAFITASIVTYPAFVVRKWLLIVIMLLGFVVPIGLEAIGVLAPSYELRSDGLLLHGSAMRLSGGGSILTIVLASIATVVMAGVQSSVLGRANRDAQHRLVTQAWHLAQLLPPAAAPPRL
jgi:serine/threonine-protein kinase